MIYLDYRVKPCYICGMETQHNREDNMNKLTHADRVNGIEMEAEFRIFKATGIDVNVMVTSWEPAAISKTDSYKAIASAFTGGRCFGEKSFPGITWTIAKDKMMIACRKFAQGKLAAKRGAK